MVDTAILQLLYAFVMKITSDNHRINWVNPSEEFIARTNLLGLSRIMGIA
jgi:anti-anti-sigma regulatory factor